MSIESKVYNRLHARRVRRLRDYYDSHDTSAELRLAESAPCNITINSAVDPVEVGKQVEQALIRLKRSNGGRPLGFE